MTSIAPNEAQWPDRIEFYLTESDDFLDGYSRLDLWTPFEAACLIRGCKPGKISDGLAKVGITLSHTIDQRSIDDFNPHDPSASDDLILLTRAIAESKKDAPMIRAHDVVRWAQERGLITPSSRLVRFVSSQSHSDAADAPDATTPTEQPETAAAYEGTGKHHEEKRLAILGFVIQELARNVASEEITRLTRGGEFNSAGLADHIHALRDTIGMPPEETTGFSHRAVEQCIRSAVREAKNYSTDKD
ncbi:hypothetical protein AZOA_12140 [Azoarcus sp. Aa7]|nr:hypothetical protein [Azoarcus sp. Aa7]